MTSQAISDLEVKSRAFAGEIGDLLSRTIGAEKQIMSVDLGDRFVVRPAGSNAKERRVPLMVGGEHLADLNLSLDQTLDRSSDHLKTVRSDLVVYSALDRTPLIRLEYQADMRKDPVAHWQIHAERGAFSHLLSIANAKDSRRVRRPHDISTVHVPSGGERFRPCLEDLLEMLIRDCGVDYVPGWEQALEEGRMRWRVRQFRSSVRDLQSQAAEVLEQQGWTVVPPLTLQKDRLEPYRRW
ncbi:hypothetical protein [Myceligenerans indicum]|uniref:Uncharacterized protein n=1 Tax=Myceligenerans indicum TaxID=2593663 RepID=A0ABS1LPF9_9MICO|nr:hypothetical protein [Myceligenerans indicum]MBL0888145.1 hypothetical protein [Myceligenerans indicum]